MDAQGRKKSYRVSGGRYNANILLSLIEDAKLLEQTGQRFAPIVKLLTGSFRCQFASVDLLIVAGQSNGGSGPGADKNRNYTLASENPPSFQLMREGYSEYPGSLLELLYKLDRDYDGGWLLL